MSSSWPRRRFGECAELIRSTCLPGEFEGIPYIGLEHIEGGSLRLLNLGTTSDVNSAKFRFEPGDILFGKLRPYFRKVVRPHVSGVCSTDIWVVRAKKGTDQDYLFYWMASQEFVDSATQASEGTRMPRAKWDFLERIEKPVPSLSEQRALAHILGTLDDKIELNRRMNQTLEAMAQALFKSWFVDFEPFRDQGMQDSTLGEIPAGWTIGELADLAAVTSGKRPDRRSHVSAGQMRIPLYGGNGPMGCVEKPLYSVPLLLTGRVGTLGMVFRVTFPCWPSDNTLVALAYGSESYEYLCFRMRAIDYNALNRGSTQPLVTQTDLQRHGLIIPPNAILCEFHNLISPLFGLIDHNGAENSILAGIRDALLPKLLSGEIRVRDAADFPEVRT